jgi:hypothetical protein
MKKVYKWTYDLAKIEAQKYKTKTEFQDNAGGCYMYALKNGFLDEICSEMKVLKKRWTKEKCLDVAKKYDFFYEFRKNENDAYLVARRNGWELEIKSFLKSFSSKWTNKQNVIDEAKKYNSKSEFRKFAKGAYESCYRNGWLEEACVDMNTPKREKKILTKEQCLSEIKKYVNKADFVKKSRAAYAACMKNNWHKEEIDNLKVKVNRSWTKEKCWTLAKSCKSKKEFISNHKGAYIFALRRGWKDEICSHMTPQFTFWTKEKCKTEALNYKSRSEYSKGNGASYQFAMKQGEDFMSLICSHMVIKGNQYKRMIYAYEFTDKYVYVGLTYNEQKRKEEHLVDKRGPVAKHISMSGLFPEYKKLEEYIDVEKAKELEQYHIDKYKKEGWLVINKTKAGALGTNDTYWTKEKCKEIALHYNKKEDLRFAPGLGGLYNAARKRGWWDEICSHMKGGNRKWTKEELIKTAKDFNTRGQFGKKEPSAYSTALHNGWLDEVCVHMKNVLKKWNYESCKKEASDFNKMTDFQKKSPSAYNHAKKNGFLKEITSHFKKSKT